MEALIKPMSKVVVDLMKIMNVTIMFTGLCRYKGNVYNFYAFTEHYSLEKGYPDKFLLESINESVYFNGVAAEECEVIWSPQANKVVYRFSEN